MGSWRRNSFKWTAHATRHCLLRAGPCSRGAGPNKQCLEIEQRVGRPRLHTFFSPLESQQTGFSSPNSSNSIFTSSHGLTLTQRQMGGFPMEFSGEAVESQAFWSHPGVGVNTGFFPCWLCNLDQLTSNLSTSSFLNFLYNNMCGVI